MLPLIMAGVGLAGAVGKAIGRGQSNRQLRALQSQMPVYSIDESIKRRLGLAQTLLNARMPGAAAAERNIYQTQANQMAGAERAATDPNQLLLTGAGAAGQAGQAFNQLGQAEAQDYQRRYGNLVSAEESMAQERQREFEQRMRNYQMQAQIQGAINENRQNMFGDISNAGFGAASIFAGMDNTDNNDINTYGNKNSGTSQGTSYKQYSWMPKNWASQGYGYTPKYPWLKQ
jgi:hypothetical protein